VPLDGSAKRRLDDIGTGDTLGLTADAVHRLRLQASGREARVVEVPPGTDPYIWTHGEDHADFAWKCIAPVSLRMVQKPWREDLPKQVFYPGADVMLAVPCRKCWPCQLQRRREWVARAMNEVMQAEKTWLLTLTFKVKPEDPSECVAEWQRYMKRLRKQNPEDAFRYVMVVETGDLRGRLHCHALVHCNATYRAIGAPWIAGHWKATLVRAKWTAGRLDDDSARQVMYVAGYITGDVKFPVRASLHYGQGAGAPPIPPGDCSPENTTDGENRDLTGPDGGTGRTDPMAGSVVRGPRAIARNSEVTECQEP